MNSFWKVFERLKVYNLTANLAKSEFCQTKITYLSKIVEHGCVNPTESKIQNIVQYPALTNERCLRIFLGMAVYYRRFCKNFSHVSLPFICLLMKKIKVDWSFAFQRSFEQHKSLVFSKTILKAPVFHYLLLSLSRHVTTGWVPYC